MVFADGVDVEADLVGKRDFLEQVAHALLLPHEMAGVRIGEAVAEGRDAKLHHHRVATTIKGEATGNKSEGRQGTSDKQRDERDTGERVRTLPCPLCLPEGGSFCLVP